MSESTETLVVCPDQEPELADTFAIAIGVLTVIGTVIAYFLQAREDRISAREQQQKEDDNFDREQALDRVRKQESVLIGPLHRLWKTQNVVNMVYRKQSGHGFYDFPIALEKKGKFFWMTYFMDSHLEPFIENPHSFEAVVYRNFVTRQLKPIYTKIRDLILNHMSDLSDMPTQDEWLQIYREEDVTSPHSGSMNINVIFDSYTAFTFEFDDIVASWAEGDFRRMQPRIEVAFLICNNLIDILYDKCKEKEAKYNKHVIIHKNTRQTTMKDIKVAFERNVFGKTQSQDDNAPLEEEEDTPGKTLPEDKVL